jgi:hypothetical protein
MIKSIERRIFNTGNSRTFALPPDWVGRNGEKAYIIYDDFLIIIPEDFEDRIDLQRIKSLIEELRIMGGESSDPSREPS